MDFTLAISLKCRNRSTAKITMIMIALTQFSEHEWEVVFFRLLRWDHLWSSLHANVLPLDREVEPFAMFAIKIFVFSLLPVKGSMYWNGWGIHRFIELWCLRRTEDERQYCHQHIKTQQICGAVQALSPIRGIVYHHAGDLNDYIPYLLLWGSVILISFVGLADFVLPLWSIIMPRQSIILTNNAFYPWWVQ